MSKQNKIAIAVVIILAILPLLRWLFLLPLNIRFADLASTATSLGQIAGLIGMALFALNLIISSRLKFFDRFFYGLDRLYHHHRQIGAIAFCLILFHPLALAIKYLLLSVNSAAWFLFPSTNWAVTFGIIGLLVLMLLIVLTFYARMKYQHWKITHKFMVAAFIFAFIHILLIPSDISRDFLLRYYLIILSLLGLAAGFYRAFLAPYINENFKYRIIKADQLANQVMQIEAEPLGPAINFLSGQFIFIKFIGGGVSSEVHPFTISSAPRQKILQFNIKPLGDFTTDLKNLRADSMAIIEGPYGKLSYRNMSSKNQIWIAGGIGITPFLSMARDLVAGEGYKIILFYCALDEQETVHLDELRNIAAGNSNFQLITWYSREKGRINGQEVAKLSGELANQEILLCGPLPFMLDLRKQLMQLGVNKNNIHFEQFKLL